MQWAVSDLAFAGFNKKYLSGLPLSYNIEFFYEFGTDHYWDAVLLPLAQNNREKRTFSMHGPCVAVNLAIVTIAIIYKPTKKPLLMRKKSKPNLW